MRAEFGNCLCMLALLGLSATGATVRAEAAPHPDSLAPPAAASAAEADRPMSLISVPALQRRGQEANQAGADEKASAENPRHAMPRPTLMPDAAVPRLALPAGAGSIDADNVASGGWQSIIARPPRPSVISATPEMHQGFDQKHLAPALPMTMSEQQVEARHGVGVVAAAAEKDTHLIKLGKYRQVPALLGVSFDGPLYRVSVATRERKLDAVGRIELDRELLFDSNVTQSGVVRALYVFPGELISKGDPIMSLYSPERINVQRAFLADHNKGLTNHLRLTYFTGFGSGQDYLEGAKKNMHWWGFSDQEIQHLLATGKIDQGYVVTSPSKGYVRQVLTNTGGLVVSAGRGNQSFVLAGATIAREARLDTVWAVMYPRSGDYGNFHLGEDVKVTVGEGAGARQTHGLIVRLHGVAKSQTRRPHLDIALDNEHLDLQTETFVRFRVEAPVTGLWVPESAVLHLPSGSSVIRSHDGKFMLVAVTTGARAGGAVEIVHGLAAGDHVVRNPRSELDPDARTASLHGWH